MTYSAATLAWAAREADRPHATKLQREAVAAIEGIKRARAAAPVDAHMPDVAIKARATDRACVFQPIVDGISG